jgi:hypothetical protein
LANSYSAERLSCRARDRTGHYVLYLGQQLRYKGVGTLVEGGFARLAQAPRTSSSCLSARIQISRGTVFDGMKPRSGLINLGSVDLQTKTSRAGGL